MQDWHQKLHNNTTPDDIVICEAYIIFLEKNGDNGAYWRHLTDNGITRQRLESFDRAIKVAGPVITPLPPPSLLLPQGASCTLLASICCWLADHTEQQVKVCQYLATAEADGPTCERA